MFSGIIERLAPVIGVIQKGRTRVLVLQSGWDDLSLGESVAINGVCLTVTHLEAGGAATFFASPETTFRSNLGRVAEGDRVNLERSMRLETRQSGHLVQGHVDGTARLVSVTPEEGAFRLELALPATLARYCVEKGSIALDGISLTINGVSPVTDGSTIIDITIIPHTWEHTNLHTARLGDAINVEVDVIAKYVERLCQPYLQPWLGSSEVNRCRF